MCIVGIKYNMPISVWLMNKHPFTAPLVYVSPTPTMVLKQTRNVDLNGKINLLYLHEWKYVSVTFLDQTLLDGYYYFIIN